MYSYQPLFSCSTSLSAPYILRSFGFSIFPVALRGISANIISFGRLYLGSSMQKSSISSFVHVTPSLTSMIAAVFSPFNFIKSSDEVLYLNRINVFSTTYDNVFLSVYKEVETVLVLHSHITCI